LASALAYVYFGNKLQRCSVDRDEARRIAANIAKLPRPLQHR
jgi:hypothetical protein